MKEYQLLMGLDQKMQLDFAFLAHNINLNGFFTSTNKAFDYLEFTPYNKGNLYKIRYYYKGYFKVFYGTTQRAYCTNLHDCLKIINQ